MLEKLSSYNLLNYLVPGVITVLVVSKTTHFNLIQQDIWLGAFFYYFVGMLVSRFGSLIIEPILKRIKTKKGSFIEFANYGDFAKASSTNPKIEVLSEANNLYRSFISSFMCIGLLIVYDHVRTISPVIINIEKPVVILLLIGDKISSAGKTLSTAVTLPLLGIGTAATKMAMDAVESENLFEVAMGGVADDARKWSEETSKALGLNAYNVRNNMATYNSMLTSMGLATDESLEMSQGLTQLSYDMASFYNLNPEEAFNKLKSGISGEAEPLKALGILVNDTTVKTYAYTHGIAKQGEQLTEAQKVQARYGAIMEATKNAQGDLARTMDSPTNKIRAMKEQAQQIGIQFGQILIPILEKLIATIKPLMDRFQGLSKEQQEMIVKIALIAAAVGPVLLVVGKVISVVGTLTTTFGAISGAMAAAGGASGAVGAAIAAITGPIGIAVAAVAGFIAIFVLLFRNNENFRNSVITIWNQVKAVMAGVFEAIRTLIAAFVQVASAIWNKSYIMQFMIKQMEHSLR